MSDRFDVDIVLKVILKTHLHNSINTPIFLDSLEYAIANKESEIIVPNGCCDTPFCEYYEFYSILYGFFKKIEFKKTVLRELLSIKNKNLKNQ